MTKRLITLLLAGILILSLFPAHVLATESGGTYQLGDTLEVEGTEAPTAKIPQGTKWEQQGQAVQKPGTDPICGKNPHTHAEESGCQLQCSLPEHTHVLNCGENCGLHVHTQDYCKAVHIHGTGCNCETEVHSHNEDCYSCTHVCDASCQIGENGICPNAHTHDESCPYTCGKEAHTHSDTCCSTQHQHSESCVPGCQLEGHTHITGGCGGEGICTTAEHTHGDGSGCQMACTLEVHEHGDGCYESITYTTWKVVEEVALFSTGNDCTITEAHLFATVLESGYPHIHELTLQPGQTKNLVFRFGTVETESSLGMGDLTAENLHFAPGTEGIAVGPTSASTQYVIYGEHRFPVTGKLPDYAFYSQATREGQYAVSGYNNAAGKPVTLYLLWADGCNTPAAITATVNGKALTLTTTTNTSSKNVEVKFNAPASGNIVFQVTPENSSTVITIELEDQRVTVSQDAEHLKVLDYNGTPVTVGFGIHFDAIRLNQDGGSGYYSELFSTDTMYADYYLGALVNYGTHEEAPAPQAFYDAIASTVRFSVQPIPDENGNTPDACVSRFDSSNYQEKIGDTTVTGNTLSASTKDSFHEIIVMSFTWDNKNYALSLDVTYTNTNTNLTANDLQTASDLNDMLSSAEKLMTWFQTKHPDTYNAFVSSGRQGFIDIYLPSVDYEDVIIAKAIAPTSNTDENYYNAIRLHGHEDGTTMPGLKVMGDVWAVNNIDFVAPESSSDTCGILVQDGDANNVIGSVNGCTFRDFDYGVKSTETGAVMEIVNSTFTDCQNAVYYDCGKPSSVNSNVILCSLNTFILTQKSSGSHVAFTLRNHPNGSSPNGTTVSKNHFINYKKDFKITTPGNPHYYHFVKNFYGNGSQARSSGGYTPRSAAIDVTENPNAVVVTNPCLVAYNDLNTLGIDDTAGLHSMIFNSESDNLKVSGTELAKIQRETKVQILDQKENTVATWIFGGAEE